MATVVILVFGEPVEPDAFHALVHELGGVRDTEVPARLRVSRGADHVWVYGPEGESLETDPDDEAAYEDKLGAPPRTEVSLELSRSPGSPELAREIAEAADRRWNVIVDNDQGGLYTVAELREDPPGPSVFWEWAWGWG